MGMADGAYGNAEERLALCAARTDEDIPVSADETCSSSLSGHGLSESQPRWRRAAAGLVLLCCVAFAVAAAVANGYGWNRVWPHRTSSSLRFAQLSSAALADTKEVPQGHDEEEDVVLRTRWGPEEVASAARNAFHRRPRALDVFPALGVGQCIAQWNKKYGESDGEMVLEANWSDAVVLEDGSSPECEDKCHAAANCSGYATKRTGSCGLIPKPTPNSSADWLPYPSSANGKEGYNCFWRHHFETNSTNTTLLTQAVRTRPKIIWGFWQNMPSSKGGKAAPLSLDEARNMSTELPPFIQLCVDTWKQLNPDYEVRMLNEVTKFDYLNRSDLPEKYEEIDIAHRADSIRLFLLEKYGGVWVDASILMLKPLDYIIGDNLSMSTFFYGGNSWDLSPRVRERRVDVLQLIENWFIAAAPNDPLLASTRKCVMQFFSKKGYGLRGGPSDPLKSYPNVFSQRQLQMLDAVGVPGYLSTHACFFRALDEDAALPQYWESATVQRLQGADTALWYFSKLPKYAPVGTVANLLFMQSDKELATEFIEHGMLKFTGWMTPFFNGLPPQVLWCRPKPGTVVLALKQAGLDVGKLCGHK